ncbi:MAG: choice-of-anchor J domain-containing protein, partial [Bacteroidia bacterium]|nr:choice-of-anchor J domain-containing protein [Bacteroidia bacterium]
SGPNVIFSDFFESQTEGQPITGNGWTNYIEAGSETWEAFFSDTGSVSLGISARMGSFMSGDDNSIGWLITPQVDFNAQEGETLKFKTSNSFSDGSTLEVLFSADWDGDPASIATATWEILSAAYIVLDDDNFVDWFNSGTVDLSCIDGTGYIAWKYVGSGDADFDGTYELDEIELRSK